MHILQINSTESHLVVPLFNKYRIFYGQPSDIVLAGQFIQQRLDQNESVILVALVEFEHKKTPVGFTQLYPTYSSVRAQKNWILNDLYVEEEHRQKGIGEKLIGAAMAFAKKEGATYVQLETAVSNKGAQRLYESIGFVKQAPDESFYTYRILI